MNNPLCHWELMVSDVKKAQQFYGKVFDWKFDDSSTPGYTLIQTGSEPTGGMMAKPSEAPACGLGSYFLVNSIEQTLSKASQAKAAVVCPKTEIPGIGWFAVFTDPDGIPVGIFEASEKK